MNKFLNSLKAGSVERCENKPETKSEKSPKVCEKEPHSERKNEFYLKKIQALEKAIFDMRKKKSRVTQDEESVKNSLEKPENEKDR